jgi:hypothetical protein
MIYSLKFKLINTTYRLYIKTNYHQQYDIDFYLETNLKIVNFMSDADIPPNNTAGVCHQ